MEWDESAAWKLGADGKRLGNVAKTWVRKVEEMSTPPALPCVRILWLLA
jgi:hypothetical protein